VSLEAISLEAMSHEVPTAGVIPSMGAVASIETIAAVNSATAGVTLGSDEPAPVTIALLPGERTSARLAMFVVVNGCTVASLVLGMGAVFLALGGNLRLAAMALLACVVFDGCDGGLARKFGVASPFGAQMDSLADLSSFGVATGIVSYVWLTNHGANPIAAGPACALLAVCAAIRLARFNVSPKNGRFFCGVPTTMAAAVLALNTLIGPDLPANLEALIIAGCAVAMVTSFPYAKLARVARLPMWLWAVPAICAMISVPAAFAAVVGTYLISGPLIWAYQHRPAALT
jgi:CDP-diacylglycerol---serine O-phosphatidyltransferase